MFSMLDANPLKSNNFSSPNVFNYRYLGSVSKADTRVTRACA